MSASLEQYSDRLLVLRVVGELKKSDLNAVQFQFVEKELERKRSSFSCF